jgi:hypothetical protein
MDGFTCAFGLFFVLTSHVPTAPQPASKDDAARREQRIVGLVRQLGDSKFARREAAHQALLQEGARILAVLDRLGPQDSAEIQRRLRSLRTALTSCRVEAVWEKKLARTRDTVNGGELNGLSGTVSLRGLPGGAQPTVDGMLRVCLYDHTPRAANQGPVLLEEWRFPPEVLRLLKQCGKVDDKDIHLRVFLPWVNTYRPEIRKVSLSVHYEPAQGLPAACRSGVFPVDHGAVKVPKKGAMR